MGQHIIIHRESPEVVHPEVGKSYRWFVDHRGVRYWLEHGGPGFGWTVFSDDLRGESQDGLFTLDEVREWAAQ